MKQKNPFIWQFGILRLIAAILVSLPLLLLPVLGMIWVWQSDLRLYWLLALAGCALLGFGLHELVKRRENKKIVIHQTKASPFWPPSANECWAEVEALATKVSPKEWPINDLEKLTLLGKKTLEIVAGHYHPDRHQPLLELTVPHTLMIIELACRDLRKEIVQHVPFSHRLTVGSIIRVNHWLEMIRPYRTWYRVIRSVLDPASALFYEIRRSVGKNIVDQGFEMMKTWLLKEYVRKTGYYAIQLYSGGLLVSEENQTPGLDSAIDSDGQKTDFQEEFESEPLRILVLGRANVGKSSLINALFGKVMAASDVVPHTTRQLTPYYLEQEKHIRALIFDTPGCDTKRFGENAFQEEVLKADLILWVTPANRADRLMEREHLDRIRNWFLKRPSRRLPPMLVVVTHIDRLPPFRHWSPPYDLNNPDSKKAENIANALVAISSDFNMELSGTIPVCLAPDRLYNVEDALMAAILKQQEDADRARFLRCLEIRRREENWSMLWKQLATSGRILSKIPEKIISSITIPPRGS